MPRNTRQTIAPDHFTEEVLSRNSWKVLGKMSENEVTMVRYLTSKIVYTDEPITLQEITVLFLSFERLVEKIAKHEKVRAKYGYDLFVFRSIYQSLESIMKSDPTDRPKKMERYFGFYRGKFISRRYYFAVKGQIQRELRLRIITRFPKRFPPKAFIGKGYGDHGTARNSAFDGSPSWQEVAMSEHPELVQVEKLDTVEFHFRSLTIHPLQEIILP